MLFYCNYPISLNIVNIDIIDSDSHNEQLGLHNELCNECNKPLVVPEIVKPVYQCIFLIYYLLYDLVNYKYKSVYWKVGARESVNETNLEAMT